MRFQRKSSSSPHFQAKADRIVAQNLSSALILEDDVDWDVRIKDQLHDFALSSQALIQPLSSRPNTYADPTFPRPSGTPNVHTNLLLNSLPKTVAPSVSPYGDGWDLLWLGHCAMVFPNFTRDETSTNTPKGRVVQLKDATVPEPQHIRNHVEEKDGLVATYPNHTRVTHHVSGAICSLAYAVSQNGARKLLYEMGVKEFTNAFDMALRVACEKFDKQKFMNSLTVQPPLFEHHRPAGKQSQWSDIRDEGDEVVETGYTQNIRWSTRLNLQKLLMGEEDYADQWPDAS
jgi:GR25 family glycosyltransferase involved in LPS biosynthesis